jgi:hypothetical protein
MTIEKSFVDRVVEYQKGLIPLLKTFSLRDRRASSDPELQKILARLYGILQEVIRLDGSGTAIPEVQRQLIEKKLEHSATSLTLDAAIELFDGLDRIVIEIGDAQYVCGEIAAELQWAKGSTTWLTWTTMFGSSVPSALKTYYSGESVPTAQLVEARRELLNFRIARSDDYQVHRARQKMRAKNIAILLFSMNIGGLTARGVLLVSIAGALGAVMSGTFNARDTLLRGSDLRAFRAGLWAQVFLGAASAQVMFLLLTSDILEIAGTKTLEGKAIICFVAGFSEPFFLGLVARVAKLGEATEKTDRATRTGAPAPGEGTIQRLNQ